MSSQPETGDSNDPNTQQPNTQQPAPANTQASSAGKKRKTMKPRSDIWDHFDTFKDAEGNKKSKCKYCGKEYFSDPSSNGTSSLWKHLNVYKKLPLSGESKQTQLSFQSSGGNEGILKKWQFDQKVSRHKLASMIIIDELPFKFVEGEGFKDFMQSTQPLFKMPSRFTVARDCYQIFVDEKKKLTSYFKMSGQRVNITTDTWTSIQKINYMCITAHYIDQHWNLNKKIIKFCPIEGHKGELLARDLDLYLKEWGIAKVFAITVDNASSNYTCIQKLKDRLCSRGADFFKGKYIHMRCIAHIVNLIVNDGLVDVKAPIKRVRKAVRFVKQSPARLAKFKECIELQNIDCKSNLCLDVRTRWNSTYLMLNVAQKLQKAFELFEGMDPYFVVELDEIGGVPTSYDWGIVRRMVDMLVHFYELTLRISGSLYVTSNVFYHEISTVNYLLKEWMNSDDVDVSLMGEKMKEKYDKYWGDVNKMNKLIYVAVVVDPRYKLEFIEFALVEEYGDEIGWKLANDTKVVIKELFEEYKLISQPKATQTQVNQQDQSSSKSSITSSRTQSALGERFMRQKMESGEVESKSELDIYLKESVYVTKSEDFDILKWWKVNSSRFPILSQLARDVLAIPISTVASESAFSTGGRVLDPYRSSLSPKVVEGLLCAQDLLRSAKRPKTIEEDFEDLEKFEEVFSALAISENVQNEAIDLD